MSKQSPILPLIFSVSFLWLCSWLFLGLGTLHAFPPAPNFTIYGIVRDQVGVRIPANGVSAIVLLKQNIEIGRAPIVGGFIDQNYELSVKIDANRAGTTPYKDSAYLAGEQLSLAVELNGQLFYPIEVSGNLTVGQGGERIKLDLNLGEDKDGDGLPDTWEEWQLYQSGQFPDNNGQWDLTQITPNGDFDNDGQLDGNEYIAGTFAGDSKEVFKLEIQKYENDLAHFEFYQITGKVYVLEQSSDGVHWNTVSFSVAAGATSSHHLAKAVGIVAAQTPSSSTTSLYRLTAR